MSKKKGEATPINTLAKTAVPQLTEAEKINLLREQRTALLAEIQKKANDAAYAEAVARLNQAYQAAMAQYPGFALNEITLELEKN